VAGGFSYRKVCSLFLNQLDNAVPAGLWRAKVQKARELRCQTTSRAGGGDFGGDYRWMARINCGGGGLSAPSSRYRYRAGYRFSRRGGVRCFCEVGRWFSNRMLVDGL